MGNAPHVMVLEDAPRLAQVVCSALQDRGFQPALQSLTAHATADNLRAADMAVVVLDADRSFDESGPVLEALEQLSTVGVPTIVWGMPAEAGRPTAPLIDCVPPDAELDDVLGRLATLAHYGPLVRRLERELTNLQRVGIQLNRYFSEIDEELRLAGRLQRDFLPRSMPQVPPLSFATLFRPASWVSGDMYDAFRIDERHVGLFMTDAMGHGIAAGLLTMFLRQALVAKRVFGRSYQIVSPAEAMRNLHGCLVRQKLPNCQFVTAAYAILNVETLELRVARGGHPYPLHITADGEIRELSAPGGLLGIPDMPVEFGEIRVRLSPGDKIVVFSDGIEDVFFVRDEAGDPRLSPAIRDWAKLGIHAFVDQLAGFLDNREGSLHPADDITILAAEIAE